MNRTQWLIPSLNLKDVADGKPTLRHHAHVHTAELFQASIQRVAKQLEIDFAFVPLLAAVSDEDGTWGY